jgi:hypothetical protein
MLKLIEDPEVVKSLLEFLPEGQQTEEGLRENILSP